MIALGFPSLCRRHTEPNALKLKEVNKMAKELDLPLDTSSARALAVTLLEAKASLGDAGAAEALTLLVTKPMQLAQYFCTGMLEPEAWQHYALAVDEYTHFTSPIR